MKKIFNLIASIFISKNTAEVIVCNHSLVKFAMKYSWSDEQKKYIKITCGGCGKNLIND